MPEITSLALARNAHPGVLQGSTLGPLLFLIYINDFDNALDKCIVHHFADDTNLLFGKKYTSEISCVINNELQLLSDWLKPAIHNHFLSFFK